MKMTIKGSSHGSKRALAVTETSDRQGMKDTELAITGTDCIAKITLMVEMGMINPY